MRTQAIGKSTLVSSRLAYGCMRINAGQSREHLVPEQEALHGFEMPSRRAKLAGVEVLPADDHALLHFALHREIAVLQVNCRERVRRHDGKGVLELELRA